MDPSNLNPDELALLRRMSDSYAEDLRTGLEDGTYEDGADLLERYEAMEERLNQPVPVGPSILDPRDFDPTAIGQVKPADILLALVSEVAHYTSGRARLALEQLPNSTSTVYILRLTRDERESRRVAMVRVRRSEPYPVQLSTPELGKLEAPSRVTNLHTPHDLRLALSDHFGSAAVQAQLYSTLCDPAPDIAARTMSEDYVTAVDHAEKQRQADLKGVVWKPQSSAMQIVADQIRASANRLYNYAKDAGQPRVKLEQALKTDNLLELLDLSIGMLMYPEPRVWAEGERPTGIEIEVAGSPTMTKAELVNMLADFFAHRGMVCATPANPVEDANVTITRRKLTK